MHENVKHGTRKHAFAEVSIFLHKKFELWRILWPANETQSERRSKAKVIFGIHLIE